MSKPDHFEIQQLNEEDIPSLMRLEGEAFPLDQWSEDAVRKEYSVSPQAFLAVKHDGRVVGYIYTELLGTTTDNLFCEGLISSIAVLPRFQRMGIGARLLNAGLQYLSTKGVEKVHLHTRVSNQGMINLASRYGFRIKGEQETGFFSSDGEDAHRMEMYFKD